jgi:hypothetical protein
MMRTFVWFLVNGLMLNSLLAGLVYGIQGAMNVGIMMVWITVYLRFCMLYSKAVDEVVSEGHEPAVPMPVSWALDLSVVLLLAWFGWIWTASFYLIAAMIQFSALDAAKKRAKKSEEP